MKTISVFGLGWLGLPLAEKLSTYFKIAGTTRSVDKKDQMSAIHPDWEIEIWDLNSLLKPDWPASDIVLINIPPSKFEAYDYCKKILDLAKIMQSKRSDCLLLFISSTSVFGEDVGMVTEESELSPESDSAHTLVLTEEKLVEEFRERLLLIRPSGLVGNSRYPGRFLAGRSNLPRPNASVNLIHLTDTLNLLNEIILNPVKYWPLGKINLSSPGFASREEFYTLAAKLAGLDLPVFDKHDLRPGKTVTSEIFFEPTLFKYPSALEALPNWAADFKQSIQQK